MTKGKDIIQRGVVLRGDLAPIHMGSYVILKENVMIRPTFQYDTKKKGRKEYAQIVMGDHVFIDQGTVVCATYIGSNVHIGKNCIIGHRCQIHDNTKILDGSVLAPDTVVAPYTVFGGQPATYQGELPESI